ncbi:HisA/HisF-related TIM barrel protein [Rhodopirellula halodulae]|uniref:HisA/HisF-related TIM barrel protein n=1 Tax=Rhodopirellula halodulae TaxID=2894198 RepID=UPI001E37D15A|nr:HisA/HisF-related TIM barrel protein [Rhodopirellula sp. JC737]MCC9657916.1 hisA/hisF family protein [Rhodopirellula sp. JC737]
MSSFAGLDSTRDRWRGVSSHLIGVLDLMDGKAVRGIAGQRHRYQPHAGSLCDPCELIRWYRTIGLCQFYVADLDSLTGAGQQRASLRSIIDSLRPGETLWIDAGWTNCPTREESKWLQQVNRAGAVDSMTRWIIATESAQGLHVIDELSSVVDPADLCLSLDFREGEFVQGTQRTREIQFQREQAGGPDGWIDRAWERGIREVIVLDVAQVGSSAGVASCLPLRKYHASHPGGRWITGGGIREPVDVQQCLDEGYSRLLVASALLPKLNDVSY